MNSHLLQRKQRKQTKKLRRRRPITSTQRKVMNFILAAFVAAAVSTAAKFLGPPILAALTSPQQSKHGIGQCEGYYPDTEICLLLGTSPEWFQRNRENAECPQWKIDTTCEGKDAFIEKLKGIETVAKEWEDSLAEMDMDTIAKCGGQEAVKPPVWIRRERGVAWSRIQEGIMAGNSEYHCDRDGGNMCWTDALLPMYVEQYGFKPSKEFHVFVSMFDLNSFRNALQEMKTRCVSE
mmetsp:Transcript_27451/g.41568  ORF Transcript_27451/g.41568 Transcript_27451/m.41568 type:complete len:236 (+) Transcript_27451:88-795(+)